LVGCGDTSPSSPAAPTTRASPVRWLRAPLGAYTPGAEGGVSALTIGFRTNRTLRREREGDGAPLAYSALDGERAQTVKTIGTIAGARECYAARFTDDAVPRLFPWTSGRRYRFVQTLPNQRQLAAELSAVERPAREQFDDAWLARRLGCQPLNGG